MSDFSGSLELDTDSDQLLVYQGTRTSPTFLCALDNSRGFTSYYCNGGSAFNMRPGASSSGWHQASCSTNFATGQDGYEYFSALPQGLTAGVDALQMNHVNNWVYTGVVVGSPSELRSAIASASSWGSNDQVAR
eukprot:2662436-Prymnesium_polylepis.1